MTIPPPRYRIVERGRRLEVIDTLDGRSIGTAPVDPAGSDRARFALPALPRRTRFDGSADLTTSRFYDDKGPRLVKLDTVAAAQLGWAKTITIALLFVYVVAIIWQPWLIAAPLLLLQDGVRKPLRAAITRWLDRVAATTL